MRCLGRLPRPANARFLRLADYKTDLLPPAPISWDGTVGATIQMYANDRLGDCTCAGIANLASIQCASEGIGLSFSEADVVAFYNAITGGQDTGAVETDVLTRVQTSGFPLSGAWKLAAWAAVNHADLDELRRVAALFSGVYLGVELPDNWEAGLDADAPWDVTEEANSDNGHALVAAKYDTSTGLWGLATWGEVKLATDAWMAKYVVEAYALLDADRLNVDVLRGDALRADIAALSASTP